MAKNQSPQPAQLKFRNASLRVLHLAMLAILIQGCGRINGNIASLFGSLDFSRSQVLVKSSAKANSGDEVVVNVRLLNHESKPIVGYVPNYTQLNGNDLIGPGCFASDATGLAICIFQASQPGNRSIKFNNLAYANLSATLSFNSCASNPVPESQVEYLGTNSCFSTRASTATYTDVDGLLKTAAVDQIRKTYDPVTHQLLGILLERESTNLVDLSGNMADQSHWAQYPSVTLGSTTAPDGGSAATVISPSSSANGFYKFLTVTPSEFYVYSGFVKAIAGSPTISVGCDNLGANSVAAPNTAKITINSRTGTILSQDPRVIHAEVAPAGSGWLRWSVAFQNNNQSSTISLIQYVLQPGEVAFWGVQQELGTSATTYIPTTGTRATRAADYYQL